MAVAKPEFTGSVVPGKWSEVALSALLLGLAAYHLALTASTVAAYGLRYPLMDEFRLVLRYATDPFPLSVLKLENGHRPVIPGLARILEMHWFAGRHVLQLATAWGSAAIVLLLIAREAASGFKGQALPIASVVCGSVTLLVWNANDRMFIHAYEAVHLFYIALALVIAVLAAMRATETRKPGGWLVAIAACSLATFTFGPGIVTFLALFTVAILLRSGPRALAGIGISFLVVLAVYVFVLPGAEGVRNSSAGTRVDALVYFTIARLGAVFVEIPRPFVANESVRMLPAVALSLVALVSVGWSVSRRWWLGDPFSRIEVLGVALIAFGFLTNALISANRADYFLENTNQLYADRYLYWSCVFWSGVFIYGTALLGRTYPLAWAIAVATFSLSAIPIAVWLNAWSSEVHRHSEVAAIAMSMGLRDDAEMASVSDAGIELTYRSIEAMRERRLFMFANGSATGIGRKVSLGPTSLDLTLTGRRVETSPPDPRAVTFVSGILPQPLARGQTGATLWIADNEGVVVGRVALVVAGQWTNNIFLLGDPMLQGIQGYLPSTGLSEGFLVSDKDGSTRVLARVRIQPGTAS